ncbi:putative bifunctional diguanylate cyclase/phosphodiesterase [Pseudomonas graminis]|uniref:putative bifunctional diguanylate cyclase/phosphodiesterase n=1 Tax=Pseudomonas graminis TaxID=158627 RepID=UPI003C19EE96
MPSDSCPGVDEKTALDNFVSTASCLEACSGAVLVLHEGGHWRIASTYGSAPDFKIEKAIDAWLKFVLSYDDVVDLNEIMVGNAVLPIGFERGIGDFFQVCIAVKDAAERLAGVVLMTVPLPRKGLSAAQICLLRTHAADLYAALQPTRVNDSAARLRLLESVVVNSKDAILITEAEPIDMPGPRIVYCNPAFLANTGFSLEEVIGQTPRILQCEESNRDTLRQLRASLQRWEPIEVELINARRDGTRFWVQMSIVPVANENGWFTHWVSVQRDITERKEAEEALQQAQMDREERVALQSRLVERERIQEELSYAAFHDELTRLKNRAYFTSRIEEALSRKGDGSRSTATVLYMDLDRFKYVNDGIGHHAGDVLLKRVAERLHYSIDVEAVVARIGGDEFAVLLTGEDHQKQAVETAGRIIQALGLPIEIEGQTLFTSCSIGIATLDNHHNTAEDLIRDADVAMYSAKKQGRGRFAIFDVSMRQASIDMLMLQSALKHAITADEFYLVFQPIFSVETETIVGVEALIRWRHPIWGNVTPDVFISVAEDIGVIHDLGQWVMRNACREVRRWRDSFPKKTIKLNVNVSGVEMNRKGFAIQVAHILDETGFDPCTLQIEITESVFLHEPDVVLQTLVALRAQGIRVALDDFGTGYSSLSYIDRYPIDVIKIDRSFVFRMMSHERSVAIVKSILSLGQVLDLAIVAEGVETQSQMAQLRILGCPYAQGILLSTPLLAEDMHALLSD